MESESLNCFDGATLAYTLAWLNGLKPQLVYLEAIAGDEDHAIVIVGNETNNRLGAIGHSSFQSRLGWRESEFPDLDNLAASYLPYYYSSYGWQTLVGYSEPIDPLANRGITWMWKKDDYLRMFHGIVDQRTQFSYIGDPTTTHRHQLVVALQQGWIKQSVNGYFIYLDALPAQMKMLYDQIVHLASSEHLYIHDGELDTLKTLTFQFFKLTGTTPQDLLLMCDYLTNWLKRDGFGIELIMGM